MQTAREGEKTPQTRQMAARSEVIGTGVSHIDQFEAYIANLERRRDQLVGVVGEVRNRDGV